MLLAVAVTGMIRALQKGVGLEEYERLVGNEAARLAKIRMRRSLGHLCALYRRRLRVGCKAMFGFETRENITSNKRTRAGIGLKAMA